MGIIRNIHIQTVSSSLTSAKQCYHIRGRRLHPPRQSVTGAVSQSSDKRYTLYIHCVDEIGIPIIVKPSGIYGYHWALKGQLHIHTECVGCNQLSKGAQRLDSLNTITDLRVTQRARNFLINAVTINLTRTTPAAPI